MGLARSGEVNAGWSVSSREDAPNCAVKTIMPGKVLLALAGGGGGTPCGSERGIGPLSASLGLLADGVSPVREAVVVEEALLVSDGRRAWCRVLDDDSEGGWKSTVSKPGFFFLLPSQLRRML